MLEIVNLRKADKDEPGHFELVYRDLEKKDEEKGYFMTTKYGPEDKLRALLKSGGVPDATIDKHFKDAL
jgi:hypothetical protein